MQNMWNIHAVHSASGYLGVYQKTKNRWHALVWRNKKQHYIGCFTSPEAAAKARQEFVAKYEIAALLSADPEQKKS